MIAGPSLSTDYLLSLEWFVCMHEGSPISS